MRPVHWPTVALWWPGARAAVVCGAVVRGRVLVSGAAWCGRGRCGGVLLVLTPTSYFEVVLWHYEYYTTVLQYCLVLGGTTSDVLFLPGVLVQWCTTHFKVCLLGAR